MKLFKTITLTLLFISLAHNANASTKSNWTTSGLDNAETQAIDDASQKELWKLSDCMNESNETEISETSCINEVFGDVHN